MRESRAAIRYAKAVLSLSTDLKQADKVNEDMLLMHSTIDGSEKLQSLLKSPVVKSNVKKSALLAVFSNINKTSQSLINQLIENKRLSLLSEVAKQYTILFDLSKGSEIAKVITAVALTKDLEQKVLAKVKEITGKNVTLESTIDPTIIGGFILRVGDKQFDASVSGKMNNLRRALINN
ncbi:MAG TPA: ATP synthase F1 subunit delta [Flavobacteriaceae bacterium]|jgi:F-type H+-transporting ATPase subunit delta|nr:ATP synthase F1 subunit delta [Flavobacteriaceae bacterium]HBS11452.1 ATP synthase F1 subunit delta [Flavobacteriaceae bacterium]